jgi:hypothetical protein
VINLKAPGDRDQGLSCAQSQAGPKSFSLGCVRYVPTCDAVSIPDGPHQPFRQLWVLLDHWQTQSFNSGRRLKYNTSFSLWEDPFLYELLFSYFSSMG